MLDKLSELAADTATRAEAREGLLRLIKEDPSNARARVILAKTYYDDGLLEFSIRELIEARKYSESLTLVRLLDAFGDHAKRLGYVSGDTPLTAPAPPKETVAEIEIDFDLAAEKLK